MYLDDIDYINTDEIVDHYLWEWENPEEAYKLKIAKNT